MLIQTEQQLAELVEYYLQQPAFCFDVETVGDHRGDTLRNRVTWIALSTNGRSDVIPMGHPHGDLIRWDYPLKPSGLKRQEQGLTLRPSDYSLDQRKATAVWSPAPEQLSPGEVFAGLEPLMFSGVIKVGHNLKFDLKSVAKYYRGRVPTGPYFDTMVAAFLINSGHRPGKAPYNRPYALASVLHRELGVEMVKGVGKEIETHSFRDARNYTVRDGKWTWLLYKELDQQITAQGLGKLMALEMDVLNVLTGMELAGAPLDMDALKALDPELLDRLVEVKSRAYKAAGREFNLASPMQVQDVLFLPKAEGGQGLKPKKLTPGAKKNGVEAKDTPWQRSYSTDKEALALLNGDNPVVAALLNHSEIARLHGTYVKSYLKDAPDLGGKIHADFNQIGAETGRFSCREPNLQNVPNASTELGYKIRSLFVANSPVESGYQLVVADYSQIEPRVLASFSGDPILTKGYLSGSGDIYTELAAPLGLDRAAGKLGYLAVSYGVQADKLASQLHISKKEAETMLRDLQRKFAPVFKYKAHVIHEAKRRRPAHVTTLLGRRRYLPDLFSQEFGPRARAERQAFNCVIQGSAADIIKLAMIRLDSTLKDELPEAQLLLQVHDELVVKCPADKTDQCVEIMRFAMEEINVLKVPLVADIHVGDNWADAKNG